MEEPLFAQETVEDFKKEEPWDEYPQEVKEEISGDYGELDPAPSPHVKPTVGPTVEDPVDHNETLPSKKPSQEPSSTCPSSSQNIFQSSFLWKCTVEGCGLVFPLVRHLRTHMFEHFRRSPPIDPLAMLVDDDDPGKPLPSKEPHREPSSTCLSFNSQIFPQPSLRFKCPEAGCGLSFQKEHHLDEHKDRHSGPVLYKCKKCPCEFQTQRLLERHVCLLHVQSDTTSNVNTGMQGINGCPMTYKVQANAKPNVNTGILGINGSPITYKKPANVRKPPTTCLTCGKVFVCVADLLKHLDLFNGQAHFFCKPCNMTCLSTGYEDHQTSKFHIKRESARRATKRPFSEEAEGSLDSGEISPLGENHPLKMSIPQWEEAAGAQNAEDILRQADPLDGNMVKTEASEGEMVDFGLKIKRTLHPEKQPETKPFVGTLPFSFKCPECEEGFHVFQSLHNHMIVKHPGVEPLWCHLCPKKYWKDGFFWLHLRKVHRLLSPPDHPAGYICDECGGHFRFRSMYTQHCQFLRGKPHVFCEPCDVALPQVNWEKHVATKHRAVKTVCLECGKPCYCNEEYLEHRESLKKKPHAFCEPCGLVLDKSLWNAHLMANNHTNVKIQFYCCNVAFRPEEWEEHQLMKCHRESTWVDKYPLVWKCPVKKCGCAYDTWNSLLKHMSVHPGVQPFPCRKCPRQFWNSFARYYHEEREHPQCV